MERKYEAVETFIADEVVRTLDFFSGRDESTNILIVVDNPTVFNFRFLQRLLGYEPVTGSDKLLEDLLAENYPGSKVEVNNSTVADTDEHSYHFIDHPGEWDRIYVTRAPYSDSCDDKTLELLNQRYKQLLDHCKHLEAKNNEKNRQLRELNYGSFPNLDVWYWSNEEDNHLESLTCPIVIPAADLKELIGYRRTGPPKDEVDGSGGGESAFENDVRVNGFKGNEEERLEASQRSRYSLPPGTINVGRLPTFAIEAMLDGVDCHSPDLSDHEKTLITEICERDPKYFFWLIEELNGPIKHTPPPEPKEPEPGVENSTMPSLKNILLAKRILDVFRKKGN